MGINEILADLITRHQVGLLRLSKAEIRSIMALLKKSEARILERLRADKLSDLSRSRQEQLLNDIRRIVAESQALVSGQLQASLTDLADYEVEYQAAMFKRTIPVNLNTVTPAADQNRAAVFSRPFQGRVLREWFDGLEENTFRRLRDEIRMGFMEGRTTAQIVRAIRGTRDGNFKDGIMEINRRAAETTVRTAVNHTANAARDSFYEANSDIIKGVQWISTLDGRTSAICRARDGEVYQIGKGPRPPAHTNCRSSTSPIVKSWRELGLKDLPPATRASMDGQVPGDLTYGEWLKRQPAGFQDEVLGDAKGKLFRKGGLTMDRFVDESGHEYTLDELKRREAAAWEAAGLAA